MRNRTYRYIFGWVKTKSATPARHPPTSNLLLAALPKADYQRLLPHLEHVPLPLGWALYESGSRIQHVFKGENDRLLTRIKASR